MTLIRAYLGAVLALALAVPCSAQTSAPAPVPPGDSPEAALPLARDLSPKLKKRDIEKAMRKVGDWQVARVDDGLTTDWTFAVLEAGLVEAADTLNVPAYRDPVIRMGERLQWQLGKRLAHADDQVVGQSYLHLYERQHDAAMIAPLRERFDMLKNTPDDPAAPVWWWCDALFMAPAVWSGLARVTGDRSYLDYMDRQWWITTKNLYDPQQHLFFRDSKYLQSTEANGQKLFWMRGNGWVLAGLARTLKQMPADYPSRDKYVQMFVDMSNRLRELQGPDGLWRPGLLNEAAYPLPDCSGSALVTYGMTWGINAGILPKKTFEPTVKKGWAGLVRHIYQDGRLGSIQPVGQKPDAYRETASYVYGVGAFLLAGTELDRMVKH